MVTHVYEGEFYSNSYRAIDKATRQPIAHDANGKISLAANQAVVFETKDGKALTSANTIYFIADSNCHLVLNGDDRCPFPLTAGELKGIDFNKIYEFYPLESCTLFFEALLHTY